MVGMIRHLYHCMLAHAFWFLARRLFNIGILHQPSDSKLLQPSVHFYYHERDILAHARSIVEIEEEQCHAANTQNSRTSKEP